MSRSAKVKSSPLTGAVVGLLGLGSVTLFPSPVLAGTGCSGTDTRPLPTGQIVTRLCATAVRNHGEQTFLVTIRTSTPWRYTRCEVHQAMKVAASVYRRKVSCNDAILDPNVEKRYRWFIDGAFCGLAFEAWGHVTVAYNHTQGTTTPTRRWRGKFC